MTKDSIIQVVKESITDILPEISVQDVKMEESLKDLGANSIDRMEIVVKSMETLGLKIPLVELGQIKNIQELVDFLYEKKTLAC